MIYIDFMTKDDILDVLAVEQDSFSDPWTENMFLGELENEHTVYLKASDGKKVVGYAGMWCVFGDADITNVAVMQKYRRKGIAKALLERLILEAKIRDTKSIRLEVRKSNLSAISLYEKFGFLKIDIRKNYYTNNREDALIMEKKIKPEEK